MPIYKEQRYNSIPLSGGWAVPYDQSEASTVNIVKRVDGQYLSGDMVPRRENSRAEELKKKKSDSGTDRNVTTTRDEPLRRNRVPGELTPLLEGDENGYASA